MLKRWITEYFVIFFMSKNIAFVCHISLYRRVLSMTWRAPASWLVWRPWPFQTQWPRRPPRYVLPRLCSSCGLPSRPAGRSTESRPLRCRCNCCGRHWASRRHRFWSPRTGRSKYKRSNIENSIKVCGSLNTCILEMCYLYLKVHFFRCYEYGHI